MSCDCEMPSAYCESQPRARKRHRCCECHGWIEPGERYQLITGVWDGRGDSYKTCRQCASLRRQIQTLTECCVGLGAMRDEIEDLDEPFDTTSRIWAQHHAIRIQRGAAICPLFRAEENDLSHLTDP